MINHNPHMSKAYFVSSFMSGLSNELRPMVKMMRLLTVEHASESAQLQEMVVEVLMKKQKQQQKGVIQGRSGVKNVGGPSLGHNTTPHGEKLIEHRRLASLCY